MKTTRRDWLQWTLGTASLGIATRFGYAADAASIPKARTPLNILVLGGTGFLGPHQIEYALARGHRITMFNRGRTAANRYGERVETLIGDRDTKVSSGLKSLEGTRRWDAVIDNSGYVPRHVRDSAQLLHGRVGRYLYISSTASYAPGKANSIDERAPLIQLTDLSNEQRTQASYGPFKATCDQYVRTLYGKAGTAVRPTFVIGPGDNTPNFPYWVSRIAAGGDVLGPPEPRKEMRWIDVRDLCPWVVTLLENDVAGAFNASAPAAITTWEQGLQTMTGVAARPVKFYWPGKDVIDELKINLPLAMYPGQDRHIVSDAAQAAGLRYRPLLDTTRAVHEWWEREPVATRRALEARWTSREVELQAIARSKSGPV